MWGYGTRIWGDLEMPLNTENFGNWVPSTSCSQATYKSQESLDSSTLEATSEQKASWTLALLGLPRASEHKESWDLTIPEATQSYLSTRKSGI